MAKIGGTATELVHAMQCQRTSVSRRSLTGHSAAGSCTMLEGHMAQGSTGRLWLNTMTPPVPLDVAPDHTSACQRHGGCSPGTVVYAAAAVAPRFGRAKSSHCTAPTATWIGVAVTRAPPMRVSAPVRLHLEASAAPSTSNGIQCGAWQSSARSESLAGRAI